MNAIIESKEVLRQFSTSPGTSPALDRVNLEICPGEFISVMGPSGSGKSTLLYSLSGMDLINGGMVYFQGEELHGLSNKKRARIRLERMGFVFQGIHLLPNLSLLDNILAPGLALAKESPRVLKDRAMELMDQAGIAELAAQGVNQVSGGQLQRAAICRALINQPALLFADEPTGALNRRSAQDIMELLKKLNRQGTTIFLVTHDIKVASMAKTVLYMEDGQINGRWQNQDSSEEELTHWLLSQGL